MDKQALINYTQGRVTATDGDYFIMDVQNFLKLMLMEDCVEQDLFRPDPGAKITNTRWWKDRLMVMTENRYQLHNDLKIVLRKDPNADGELDGFIFDAFLFCNITLPTADRIRHLLNEVGRGLYKNNQELTAKKRRSILKPYYVRLMDPVDTSTERGILILRNFY